QARARVIEADQRLAWGGLRAAVAVVDPIEGLRLVGAAILGVVEAVAVAIGARAAVQARVGARRARDQGAGVFQVWHVVAVGVRLRTAVVILDAVAVLGDLRTAIGRTEQPIAVLVARRAAVGRGPRLVRAAVLLVRDAVLVVVRVDAAVVVLEVVLVLAFSRAAILVVGDAVIVVVEVRTAVVIFEPVEILGELGALVVRVGHSVSVGVVEPRRPTDAQDDPHARVAHGVVQGRLHAADQRDVPAERIAARERQAHR